MLTIPDKIIPRRLADLKIRNKLFFAYSLLLIIAAGIGTITLDLFVRKGIETHIEEDLKNSTDMVIRLIRTAASGSIKNNLRAAAELNRQTAVHYYQQFRLGILTEEEAKNSARSVLLDQKIGKTGYVFVWDISNAPESVILAIHPKIQGQDVGGVDFVKKGVELKNGYLEYEWKNPDEDHLRAKAMYLAYFEPWRWVIAASSYRDEFLDLMDVSDFHESLLSVKLGLTGYLYIIDSMGNVVFHPAIHGNVYNLTDGNGRAFIREICSRKRGRIAYTWKNPGENEFRSKLVFFDYIPEYDWIVAASSYVDEYSKPLFAVRYFVIFSACAIVLLVLVISSRISYHINAPLQELVDAFNARDVTNFSVRLVAKSRDEIGQLVLGFNDFMDKLQQESKDRKLAEEERARLAAAMEQASEGVCITDSNWIISYVNPAFAKMSGYERADLIGRHLRILKNRKHGKGFYRNIREVLLRGEVWSGRLTNTTKSGRVYEVDATASPVRNASGRIVNYVAIHRDITQQVQLETELHQARKMEAIGLLAGGIAHDFNNILAAIIGFTELCLFKITQTSPIRKHLEQVLRAASRAADLVKQILTYTRRREQERKPVSLAPITREVLRLLRSSLPATIEIELKLEAEAGRDVVLADPAEIHQVLMNLCTNAAHAMRPKGGTLSVRVYDCDGASTLSGKQDLDEKPCICLAVGDTGKGIDPGIIERIFDPYFTTKGVGEGTGLGLSVVHGIVKSYGGTITVASEPGDGATFYVVLPRLEQAGVSEAEIKERPAAAKKRILFVDDEQTLVTLGKEVLESIGHEVTALNDPVEALDIFRAQSDAFDLVITDLTMPNMTGKELAREIAAIRPGFPVILCTGFAESMDGKLRGDSGISETALKPYSISTLAETIRRAVESKWAKPEHGGPDVEL